MSVRQPIIWMCVASFVVLWCAIGCNDSKESESSVEWVDPNEILQGPIVHDRLSDELLVRIKSVHATFADVEGTPLEKWIEDFKRDRNPSSNVQIWEDMVIPYEAFCGTRDLPIESRKEAFKIVLMRSMMSDEDVLARLELKHLSKQDAEEIIAAYPSPAKPIEVYQSGNENGQ